MTTIVKDRLFNISKSANIDEKYGPYASELDANTKLSPQGAITVGLTVGITQSDGSIKEYWYQPDGQGGLQLVEKQADNGGSTQLATKQELQQGLSGKQDIISDLQQIRTRANEGHTALQPKQSGQYTQGNIVVFDENGGLADSQKNTTDFATASQGTKADNAIPMPTGTDGQILEKDSNETSGVKWVNKPSDGQDGASAYELYEQAEIAAGRTPLSQEAWLASLKANIGEFLFVPTDAAAVSAMAKIGQTYSSAIDPQGKNVAPTQNTLSVILLMNDDATTPSKTMMIVTQESATPGTYEFIYAGDLQSAMPSNVLTETDIDNDFAGGSDKVAGADEVKSLKEEVDKGKVYIDVIMSANLHNSAPAGSASEPKPENGADWAGHIVQANVGTITASSNYVATDFIEIEPNTDYKSNTQLRTVAFYREKDYTTFISVYPYLENITVGSRITSPNNAKYVRFSYYSTSPIPANVKFGKYADDINVDYSVGYVDKDYYGNEFALKNDNSQIDGSRITDGTITNEKLSNGTITNDKIKYPLPIVLSNNLFDKNTMVNNNHYVGINGSVNSASGWACTSYIEIEPNTDYYFYARTWGRDTGYIWCMEDRSAINGSTTGNTTIAGIHTSPSNAKYVVFNIKSNGVDSTDVMLAKSSTAIPYEEYGVVSLPTSAIKDFSKEVNETVGVVKKLNATKNGNSLIVSFNNDRVVFNLESNSTSVHSANPVCNISSRTINGVSNPASDDIAPMHILNTTLGANHAQPIQKVTISAHGLTNQDVGTEWVRSSDSKKFYIVRIVDTDNVCILSENTRSYNDPVRVKLSQGDTLSKDGTSLTVESVADAQMYPALKNHVVQVYCDDNIITNDGNYTCNKVSIVEGYDIMNPESVLQNLITNVGSSDEPVYDGNSAVRVENVYTFDSSITMTVLTTVMFLEAVRFGDIMSTQLTKAASKYYVPNSLPIASGIDLRTPSVISWTSSTPLCNITQDKVDNTEYPINRVLQYGNNVGYAIGYLQDVGVAQKINKYTSTYFEIRNNSGKIYPHPVDYAKTLTYQNVGNVYTSLMYVAPFVPEESGSKRLSIYTVKNGDNVYIYVDYIDSILDKVIVDNSFNGKKITVLESSNAELLVMDNNSNDEISNNIYNNGFYINANYVDGETCYIILKIG